MRTKITHRLNITLPARTVRLLNRVASPGKRSRLIDQAVRYYIDAQSRSALRDRLKEGAIARSERDRDLAEEWFPISSDAWPAK